MKSEKNSPPVPPQHQGRISNVDGLLRAIEAYFDSCDDQGMSYTLAGLQYYLGVIDKQLLWGEQVSKSSEPQKTVKLYNSPDVRRALQVARLRIQAQRATQLLDDEKNTQAQIFDLKANFAWVDKQGLEVTSPDNSVGSKVAVVLPAAPGSVSMDEWQKMYQEVMSRRKSVHELKVGGEE
ncbi:conserved hypothetical protein [Desulfonatronospira thiodismutans ASO3-1]|uniref:Uncharacterized protein n=1 Tax=Desulfonatronospira thiodismutans ASO3-1 TaxID=555779 RepID=D6SJW0_9BACT|nr:terminase small subunit [Desulfonatronospira thiodismutans]EFI36163.1 conserved hypothetical protein [Desulfonatronospira thiodismutans ASO3-1]